jgi:ribosomal-protein-serine acetyltransferase
MRSTGYALGPPAVQRRTGYNSVAPKDNSLPRSRPGMCVGWGTGRGRIVAEGPGAQDASLPIGETDGVDAIRLSDVCCLRLLEEADADELYALIDFNRAHLGRWMPWSSGQTREDTLEFIRMTRRQAAANNGLQMAVVSEERIVGVVGFHALDWTHRRTSIGYWLSEEQQGRGTMTRAVRALIDHALDRWQINRIELRIAPENSRSRALAERLGFREEGTLRQAERIGDRYLDSVVYAMLAADWGSDPACSAQSM